MKKTLNQSRILLLLCALSITPSLSANTDTAEPFRNNDRWAVIGDSITQGRTYYAWVYLYYATRFPELKLDVYNCGISGDSASGALIRYDWDIQPNNANVATIMMGMNDVGRKFYNSDTPDEATLKQREDRLRYYRANLTKLTKKLQSDGARVILITPSPFDETAEIPRPHQYGVNGALDRCATIMREIADETDSELIDLHGPMTELNLRLQKDDPSITIVGPDRIHPQHPGQFVMAYYLLKGQHQPSNVSTVTVNGANAELLESESAEVTNLELKHGTLSFTSLENSLPYPIPQDCEQALDWIPFQKDFNQEILRVTNLPDRVHTLFIDGVQVGQFESDEFNAGLNLATLKSAPQVQQAESVLKLVREWQKAIAYWDRGVAHVEHTILRNEPHPVDLKTARAILEPQLEEMNNSDEHSNKYNSHIIRTYLEVKPEENKAVSKIKALVNQIHTAAQPISHHYEIR